MGEPKKKPGRSRKNGTDWELRRYVMLLAAVIVLILIGAVAMFSGKITNILGKKDGLPAEMVDTGGSGMVIEPDTKEYIQDFGGCILTENGEPGITELMNTYFQAVSDCDMDTFVKLFTSQDTSEEEHYRQEFEEQKQYISGYQNVKCYTTPGLRDGEMAAYVYYEILYTGVETPAPSLVRIYAIRAEDGSWQIDDGKMSEELTQYFEELSVNEDVRLLSKQTDEAMDAAMEQDEALMRDIRTSFPNSFTQGGLDRKKLGQEVFSHKDRLEQLNGIVARHLVPEVRRRLAASESKIFAIDAINLLEGGLDQLCDRTIAVTAPLELRVRRIMARDNITEQYARLRISAQQPDEYYRGKCDCELNNAADTAAAFEMEAREFFQRLIDTIKEEKAHGKQGI